MTAAEELRRLAAEYVLGTLSGEERAAARLRLEAEPDFRDLVKLWENRFAPLHELAVSARAPESLWDLIRASLTEDIAQPAEAPAVFQPLSLVPPSQEAPSQVGAPPATPDSEAPATEGPPAPGDGALDPAASASGQPDRAVGDSADAGRADEPGRAPDPGAPDAPSVGEADVSEQGALAPPAGEVPVPVRVAPPLDTQSGQSPPDAAASPSPDATLLAPDPVIGSEPQTGAEAVAPVPLRADGGLRPAPPDIHPILPPRARNPWPLIAALCLLVAIAFASLLVYRELNRDASDDFVAVLQEGGHPPVMLMLDAESGAVVIRYLGEPPPVGMVYRLWLISHNGGTRLLCVFRDPGAVTSAAVAALTPEDLADARLQVTLEPVDAPQSVPMGRVVFFGQAASQVPDPPGQGLLDGWINKGIKFIKNNIL